MKKGGMVLLVILATFLVLPAISAEIIINSQPDQVYNVGDEISVPVTIIPSANYVGVFQANLVCGVKEQNFYKNGVSLKANTEKKIEASLILTDDIISGLRGDCLIKAFVGDDFALTNYFKISDLIIVNGTFKSEEFSPGDVITVSGQAVKDNGVKSDGIVEFSIIDSGNKIIEQIGKVNKGLFNTNLTLPETFASGNYLLDVEVYEQDSAGRTTNHGSLNKNVFVKQIPTNIEIFFENNSVSPGEDLNVKAILRDQTGNKMDSQAYITVKKENNKIFEQREVSTDSLEVFRIPNGELPSTWKVVAVSNKISSEATFEVLPKEEISTEIVDSSVTITNTGNVYYNKSITVNIGNKSFNLDVSLPVGKSQKYALTAPDGNYDVTVYSGDETLGANQISLTGDTIDVRKAYSNTLQSLGHPLVWLFALIILASGTFVMLKKRKTQRHFSSRDSPVIDSRLAPKTHNGSQLSAMYRPEKKAMSIEDFPVETKGPITDSKNPAEISSSVKGSKQEVTLVSINLKNFREVNSNDGGSRETLQKIVNIAEDRRAMTYQDTHTIVFILSPEHTKHVRNEKTALDIAMKAKEILLKHNKLFRQRIDFGISINNGDLVGSHEHGSFKFMALGSLMTSAKRISSTANHDILLGERVNEALKQEIKTVKHSGGSIRSYSIRDVKNSEEHAKFLKTFTERFKKEHGNEED